jgi:hypothetical protein
VVAVVAAAVAQGLTTLVKLRLIATVMVAVAAKGITVVMAEQRHQ